MRDDITCEARVMVNNITIIPDPRRACRRETILSTTDFTTGSSSWTETLEKNYARLPRRIRCSSRLGVENDALKIYTIRSLHQASVKGTLQEGLDTSGILPCQQGRLSEWRFPKEVRDTKILPSMIDDSWIWKHSVLEFESGMNQGILESNSAVTAACQVTISGSLAAPVSLGTSRSKDYFADMKKMVNRSETLSILGPFAHWVTIVYWLISSGNSQEERSLRLIYVTDVAVSSPAPGRLKPCVILAIHTFYWRSPPFFLRCFIWFDWIEFSPTIYLWLPL